MTERRDERYVVKIVFRGLFLAHVTEPTKASKSGSLEVLLPEASSPAIWYAGSKGTLRALLTELQPLHEHVAVLEFPVADWDNRSLLTPGLIEVDKPTKEPVAMFFLKGRRVKFGGVWGQGGTRPESLIEDESLYTELATNLLLLGEHTDHGIDQLPGFRGTPVDAGRREAQSAAVIPVPFGEVYTTRRSRSGEQERLWEEADPAKVNTTRPDPNKGRAINLDLVVRFELPMTSPLLITCEPMKKPGPDDRAFILRPREGARSVTVWVKNRELEATLADSDLDPDPYDMESEVFDHVDRDHAFFMRLAEKPEKLTVPRDVEQKASDVSGGCGGTTFPPPKPGG